MSTTLTQITDQVIERLEREGQDLDASRIGDEVMEALDEQTRREAIRVGAIFRARYRLRARRDRKPNLESDLKSFMEANPQARDKEVAEFFKGRFFPGK